MLTNQQKQLQEKQIKQLEEMQKAKGLTEQEKDQLATQLDELKKSMMTKEELQAREADRMKNEHKVALESATNEAKTWQSRFSSTLIENEILSVGSREKVLNNTVLASILGPRTNLEEVKDAEGKSTGKFVPKVTMDTVDKEGKPVTLVLTVEQAVKNMKEDKQYHFMFESTAAGGLGASTSGTGGNKPLTVADVPKMSPEEYRKKREQIINS